MSCGTSHLWASFAEKQIVSTVVCVVFSAFVCVFSTGMGHLNNSDSAVWCNRRATLAAALQPYPLVVSRFKIDELRLAIQLDDGPAFVHLDERPRDRAGALDQ